MPKYKPMPKMPTRRSNKAKGRKVADLSESGNDSQTKLNFSMTKDSVGRKLTLQGSCTEVDTLCVEEGVTEKEVTMNMRSVLEEGSKPARDSIEQVSTSLKPHQSLCTSLSKRLHQPKILTGSRKEGSVGTVIGRSEGSVVTKRRKSLKPRHFTPNLHSLPYTKGLSRKRKPQVCSGGGATGTGGDYLPLVGGAKKVTVREESVVVLDSEEEEEEKEGDAVDTEVIHTSTPKDAGLGEKRRRGEEGRKAAVVEDNQGFEHNSSGGVVRPQAAQDGAGETLCLSLEEESEVADEESQPEPMDTSSGVVDKPVVEGMEVDEQAGGSSTSVGEGGGRDSTVDLVLLSDEEKSVATEQRRGSPTPSRRVNPAGGGSLPHSPVPSKISEKFRVTPSKPTRTGETTPTEQWEPPPITLTHAPQKKSRSGLEDSAPSREGEFCEKKSELEGKEGIMRGREKEFGGKEKLVQEKEKQPRRSVRNDTTEAEWMEPGTGAHAWEEEEDPLVAEDAESQVVGSSAVEMEGKDMIESDEGGTSPQQGRETSVSPLATRKTAIMQADHTGGSVNFMSAELKRQKSLNLRHRNKCLSPLQQGLNDVTSGEEEGGGGSGFYKPSRKSLADPSWKNTRKPPPKATTLTKGSLFKLRNDAGNVTLKKKFPESSTPLNAQRNPFSKGGQTSVNQSEQTGVPRLSTELEFLANEQQLCANSIQLGSLPMVATSTLNISSTAVEVTALANGVKDTLHLQLRWGDLLSMKVHFKTHPRLVVLRPTVAGANKLRGRLITKGIKDLHLTADGKDPLQKYIVIQLPKPVPLSVEEDVLEILQHRCKTPKEFILTEEEADSFMKMVDRGERPPQRSSEYALRHPRSVHLKSASSTSDLFDDSDDDTSIPDISASLSRRPVKTDGQSSVNLCTETQRPRRRSTRSTPGFKLPSDIPHVDYTFRPQSGNQSIRVLSNDLRCLEEGEFLNDTVINFYLMYLWDKIPADKRESVYILSSFFFTRLSNTKLDPTKGVERTPEREHARVKNWTKSVDIFSKDIIIVPVCYMSHWFMFIVMHPSEFDKERRAREVERKKLLQKKAKRKPSIGSNKSGSVVAALDVDSSCSEVEESLRGSQKEAKEGDSIDITSSVADETDTVEEEPKRSSILVLDSLGARRPRLSGRLVKYLTEEWRCKKDCEDTDHFQGFPIEYPQVPLQPNSSDCGIYLLHFVQELFENLASGQPAVSGGQLEWSNPPEDLRRSLFTLVTDMNSQKDSKPQTAHAQNVADP